MFVSHYYNQVTCEMMNQRHKISVVCFMCPFAHLDISCFNITMCVCTCEHFIVLMYVLCTFRDNYNYLK